MTPRNQVSPSFDLGGTVFFRGLGLVLGLLSSLLIVGTMTQRFGSSEYAAFALIASFINLLPFADLGLGASVVNAVADQRSGALSRTAAILHVSRARDVLTIVAVSLIGIALALWSADGWDDILGNVAEVEGIAVAAAVTLAMVGISIPLGLGNRMLQGNGRMRKVVQIALLGPLLQGLGCIALTAADAPAASYAYLPGIAYLAVAGVSMVAGQATTRLRLLTLGSAMRSWRRDTVRLSDTAVPFLLISVSLAIGFQSHRLILAQVGTTQQLAVYSIAAQFAGPVLALITVAAQNLWSQYRGQQARGELTRGSFLRHVGLFASIGIFSAIGLTLIIRLLAPLITAENVVPSLAVSMGAGFYALIVAVHQPSAMLLNTRRGLWTQATLVSITAGVSVVLIVALVPVFGAATPYWVFGGTMLCLQVLPTLIIAVRTIPPQTNRRIHEAH